MSKKKRPRPEPESLGLPCVGVETHAHLDMEDFDPDREALLDKARAAGVALFGNVFLGPGAYARNKHLFDGRDDVFFLMGVHPNDAAGHSDEDVAAMYAAFRADERLRALGEIGLDYYWDHATPMQQQRCLADQLALAKELDLPVVIHSRDAEDDTVKALVAAGFAGRAVLWHCFGQGPDFARHILDQGWHISIPGPVTYRKNDPLRAAAAVIPLERMVLETDCPYLTPEPWRGKRNHPALMAFTARAVAEAQGTDTETVWRETAETARRFFGV